MPLKNLTVAQKCYLSFGTMLLAFAAFGFIGYSHFTQLSGAGIGHSPARWILLESLGGLIVALTGAALSLLLARSSREALRLEATLALEREARTRVEAALRESKERYLLLGRGANDGLWDWNLRTNAISFSARWKAMLGYNENEFNDSLDEWFSRVHPDDSRRLQQELSDHLNGNMETFECEYRVRHRDGTFRWMMSRGVAAPNGIDLPLRIAGSLTDITERRAVERELLHDILHDTLTGLPNRAMFMDQLEHMVERSKRQKDYLFAVLFLDLDGFKKINDTLGHAVGDQLLIAVARKLKVSLRAGDTVSRSDMVARLAGDEFTILLDGIKNIGDATLVADRIQRELEKPLIISGHGVSVSCSVGVALGSSDYQKAEDILTHADKAMYQAKKLGKARHVIFDMGAGDAATGRLSLGDALPPRLNLVA